MTPRWIDENLLNDMCRRWAAWTRKVNPSLDPRVQILATIRFAVGTFFHLSDLNAHTEADLEERLRRLIDLEIQRAQLIRSLNDKAPKMSQ